MKLILKLYPNLYKFQFNSAHMARPSRNSPVIRRVEPFSC